MLELYTIQSALLESWQQLSLSDKRYIINRYGSFGQWMNANLGCFKINVNKEK